MIEIKGKYNEAKIFTDVVDSASIAQVQELCNQEFTAGSRIRLMPDIHAGAGCTIGTTMTITDKVVPNLVGVDIGYRGEPREQEKTASTLDIINQTLDLMGWEITRLQEQLADVMILPKVRHINPYTMKQAQECIELGRVAARERVEDIKKAALKRAAELEQRKGEVESSGQ